MRQKVLVYDSTRVPLFLAALSILTVGLVFLLQGNVGLNLADEGFLWYGAQRVMQGEVPIRDFMSYDPGRYYWSAAIMSAMADDGILSLRIAVAAFQALGLFLALMLLVRRLTRADILWIALAIGTLLLWMYPRHKLFDITLSIASIAALAHLIEQPSARRYWLTGVCIGLVAVFGRNHGLYGAIGSLLAIAYLAFIRRGQVGLVSGLAWWSAGVFAGYLPVLLGMIFVPGFGAAFWESVRFLFEVKGTNLPLPVPWPWLVPVENISMRGATRGVLVGCFFIGALAFGLLGIAGAVRAKYRSVPLPPVLIAAISLALPYAHYAFSRADVGHLAQGIFPLLTGCLYLVSTWPAVTRTVAAAALFIASLLIMLPLHPGWQSHQGNGWSEMQIGPDRLTLDTSTATEVKLMTALVAQYGGDHEPFIAAPYWPGAYALFQRRSPMWETYALFPRSVEFQQAEIKRIESANPRFAIVADIALDGRDELRFRNTHALIDRYIRDRFDPVKNESMPESMHVYRARRAK